MVHRQKNLILSSRFEKSVWKWARNEMPATGSSIMSKQLPVSLDDKSLILGSVSVKTQDPPQYYFMEWVPGMLGALSIILWRGRIGTRRAGGTRKHLFPSSFICRFSTLLHFRLRAGTYSPHSTQCSLDHFLSVEGMVGCILPLAS